jgi:aprataxin
VWGKMSFYRGALRTYIERPEKHGALIRFVDEKFVILEDGFPKAKVHYLVMPRDQAITRLHPVEALSKPEFYMEAEEYVEKAIELACKELREKTGCKHEQEYYEQFLRVGIHSSPSMDNMHIHVMSKDMCSDRMKKALHYSSFTTKFFIPLEEAADLPEDDERRDREAMEQLVKKADLICWKCDKNFKRSFASLKPHLMEECSRIY